MQVHVTGKTIVNDQLTVTLRLGSKLRNRKQASRKFYFFCPSIGLPSWIIFGYLEY